MGLLKAMSLIIMLTAQLSAYAGDLTIYLSPKGNDSQDGQTAARAILTLKRAHQLVAAHFKKTPSHVNVLIAPGTYYNQTVIWTTAHPKYHIRIKSTVTDRKPVFDGRIDEKQTLGNQRSFFIMKNFSGATNITLENLLIRYYTEAVGLNGDRDDEKTGFNSHNKILRMTFDKIGSRYHVDQASPGYAVLRLVNSRKNEIKGNLFTNIVNKTRPELLHSIYAAHYSHENIMEGNVFKKQPGDPLRVRDFSNFNVISNNEFESAGAYAYSEWYCEKADSSACTKKDPECPSWGSSMRSNIYSGSGLFHYYVRPNFSNASSACKKNAPAKAENRRLRTSSNVTSKSPGGTKTAKGYFIESRLNSKVNTGYCPRPTDCVSTGGSCYVNGGGTSNHLCMNNDWKSR